jgi:hypothetical protein
MKNFVITIAVLIVAAVVCNKALPEGGPTYATLSKNPEATVADHMLARVAMPMINWQVDNYVFFKTARGSVGSKEILLVTTPISEGKWHRYDLDSE